MTGTSLHRAFARTRPSNLLAAVALGVYLLVLSGGTAAITDASAACPTWPTCEGAWVVSLLRPAAVVALAHRAATLVVGLALAVVAVAVWSRTTRRVRGALGAAVVLFPVQVGIGALTVGGQTPIALASVHLLLAMAIFSALLVALTWQLEAESPSEEPPSATSDPRADVSDPVATPPDPPEMTVGRVRARGAAYLRMTKPKLMWLLCLVAVAAMALAGGQSVDPGTAVATLAGGVLAVGASGVFNNVFERDVDGDMSRTADRPLVAGQVPVGRAVAFGLALAAASMGVFLAFVNALAAVLGLLAILFYSVVYTLVLKPNTDQNVVVGGAVGAFPALIGWAAVTNAVALPAVVLGLVVFLWTPAHFYNLALAYEDDYRRAGFPMLPVVRGRATTRRHILGYLGATMLAVAALGWQTRLGWVYAVVGAVASGVFLWAVLRLYRERTDTAAFRTFHAANAYLGALLVAVVVDGLVL